MPTTTSPAPLVLTADGDPRPQTVYSGDGPARHITVQAYTVDDAPRWFHTDGTVFRLAIVHVRSDGTVSTWSARQTRKGTDYVNGDGINESLGFLATLAPDLAELVATALAPPADPPAPRTTFTVAELLAIGGRVWRTTNVHRVYLAEWWLLEGTDLEVEFYRTGNVRSAAVRGLHISNTVAASVLGTAVYLDVATGRLRVDVPPRAATRLYPAPTVADQLADSIRAAVAAAVAALPTPALEDENR